MLRDLNVSSGGRRDSTSPQVGVLASEIPAGGALPAWLLNDIDSGFPSRQYSLEILTLPSAGMLYLDKAGVGSFTGAPDGTYAGTQRVRKYDPGTGLVSTADTTYTLTMGTAVVTPPSPTVTSVVVSPATATGSAQFSAQVNGLNSPSQGVTWTKTGSGTLSTSGNFVAPAPTNAVQTIQIVATSQQDGTTQGFATVTIAAAVVVVTPPPTSPPPAGKVDASQFINRLPIGSCGQRSMATLIDALIDDIQNLRLANIRMAAKLDAAGLAGANFVATATVPDAAVILGK